MHGWRGKLLSFLLLTVVAVAGQAADVEWGYEGDIGPDNWGLLDESFALCDVGQTQSPVDITTFNVDEQTVSQFELSYNDAPVLLFNNGHTIEMDYETGSFMEFDGNLYELLQFHFHAPSEHTINGQLFAMEMHMVHLCGRCFFNGQNDSIVVLGLLIEEGPTNQELASLWTSLPGTADEEVHLETTFNALSVLPDDLTTYRYDGSLTTPPCTEGVGWLLLRETITMSASQINFFKTLLENSCCGFNNRPVQPLNGRVVTLDVGSD